MINIKHTPEDIFAAVQYFGGLYSQLTNQVCAFVIVEPEEYDKYEEGGCITHISLEIQNLKYIKSSVYSQKLTLQLPLLEEFILNNCIFRKSYQILNQDLVKEFEKLNNCKIDKIHEFPALMNIITEKYPYIIKDRYKGYVIYKGLKVKSNFITKLPVQPIMSPQISSFAQQYINNTNYITIPENINKVIPAGIQSVNIVDEIDEIDDINDRHEINNTDDIDNIHEIDKINEIEYFNNNIIIGKKLILNVKPK